MIGYEDLTSRRFGTLEVLRFARRNPEIAWYCKCSQCGTEQVQLHRRLQLGVASCGYSGCGKTQPEPPGTSHAWTVAIPTLTRARDSEEHRKFYQQEQQRLHIETANAELIKEMQSWPMSVRDLPE